MVVILFILAAIVGAFSGGLVTSTLWLWFMVPLGVKAITYWHAVGLGALFSCFIWSRGISDKSSDESFMQIAFRSLMFSIFIPGTLFIIGWIAKINL